MCQHLHVLPEPGGLLDQDSFLIAGMDMVVDAQATKRQLDAGQGQKSSVSQGG
jgi:hypothetical protein